MATVQTDFGGQGLRAEISWALLEWARNPYVLLVTIFVFAPYFVSEVVGDSTKGQALLGYANGFAGFLVALSAPVLGAIADRGGLRKIPLLTAIYTMCVFTWLLWYAAPGEAVLTAGEVALLLGITIMLFEYSAVFHNSLLVAVTSVERIGFTSGMGLSLGNLGGLVLLVFVLFTMVLPGTPAQAIFGDLLPTEPLFGIEQARGEHNRAMGPLVAIWMAIFCLPLLFFVSEGRQRRPIRQSVHEGMEQLWGTVRKLSVYQNIGLFLLARMMYNDGKTAILIFGGVLAASVFGWGTLELVFYGIWLSIFAVVGGIVGAWLERGFGPRRAIFISIGMTTVTVLSMLMLSPDRIFWQPYPEGHPYTDWPMFNTLPEIIFLLLATQLALFITAAYSNSRSMMARLVPRDMATEFFGMYALSGTATAFVGPLLVALFTEWFDDIKVGFGSTAILLVIGFVMMFWVREHRAETATATPISSEDALRLVIRTLALGAGALTVAGVLSYLWHDLGAALLAVQLWGSLALGGGLGYAGWRLTAPALPGAGWLFPAVRVICAVCALSCAWRLLWLLVGELVMSAFMLNLLGLIVAVALYACLWVAARQRALL